MQVIKHVFVGFSIHLVLFMGLVAGVSASELNDGGQLSQRGASYMPDSLSDAYAGRFRVGVAIASHLLAGTDDVQLDMISKEFNAITAENAMKPALLQPKKGEWEWQMADKFVEFGEGNDMYVLGHTLVWHSQAPDWLFLDEAGQPVTKAELFQRQEDYIRAVVGRYKGRVHAWDVVNEAEHDGKGWRQSEWYRIGGPEFMERAFRIAHEVDPKAHLIYNDYNMHMPEKRAFLVALFKDYLKRGVPIHGVGLQAHVGLDYPDLEELEKTIIAMGDLGLKVHITELDVDVLPFPSEQAGADITTNFEYSAKINPYVDGLPPEAQARLTARYVELFNLFKRHEDVIERVTLWGFSDRDSWKNHFPVRGRTNYPLLFDRNFNAKPAYRALLREATKKAD